jgi:hypothetical protein
VINFSSSSSCNHQQITTSSKYGCSSKSSPKTVLKQKQKDYLFHVLFHDARNISARLEVAKEGTLQSPLTQEVQRMSLECIIQFWYSNKYCNTPTLTRRKKILVSEETSLDSWNCIFLYSLIRTSCSDYIMNAFKCRHHGLDASSTFNSPIHSSVCHISNHLSIIEIQMLNKDN